MTIHPLDSNKSVKSLNTSILCDNEVDSSIKESDSDVGIIHVLFWSLLNSRQIQWKIEEANKKVDPIATTKNSLRKVQGLQKKKNSSGNIVTQWIRYEKD